MSDSFAGKDQVPAGQGDQQQNQAGVTEGLTPEQIQAILKRDQHAQEHIQRLEAEAAARKAQEAELAERLANLERELEKRASLEELLAKKASAQPDSRGGETKPLDVDSVVTKVLQSMEQRTQAERAKANRVAAIEAAKSVYGDSYNQKISETAKELGMTLNEVDDLAGRSPQAFARVFGLQTVADNKHRNSAAPATNSEALARQQQGNKPLPTGKARFGKDAFELIAQRIKQNA